MLFSGLFGVYSASNLNSTMSLNFFSRSTTFKKADFLVEFRKNILQALRPRRENAKSDVIFGFLLGLYLVHVWSEVLNVASPATSQAETWGDPHTF